MLEKAKRLFSRTARLERRKAKFVNESGMKFSDISSEKYRWYVFPNNKTLRISGPLFLNVSKSEGHRIYDIWGNSWYVKPNQSWYMKWRVRRCMPNFVR